MNNLFPFLLFLFIIGAVAIGIAYSANNAKSLNETYEQLARRVGGTLHAATWFGRPSVTFHHRGNWVRVDIHSTGGKNPTHYTQVHMGWPDPGFRCEVYPEGFFHRIGKFLGMEDIEIGSTNFDRDYIITGSDPGRLREMLTAEVQGIIHRLRVMHGNSTIYVGVKNYELLVKKLGLIRDVATLNTLVKLTLDLHDAMQIPADQGIEFVEGPASQSEMAEDPMCQICGEVISSDLVLCRSCQTPHHHDCWQYYGQCSTFGCGEHGCYRPRPAKVNLKQ